MVAHSRQHDGPQYTTINFLLSACIKKSVIKIEISEIAEKSEI